MIHTESIRRGEEPGINYHDEWSRARAANKKNKHKTSPSSLPSSASHFAFFVIHHYASCISYVLAMKLIILLLARRAYQASACGESELSMINAKEIEWDHQHIANCCCCLSFSSLSFDDFSQFRAHHRLLGRESRLETIRIMKTELVPAGFSRNRFAALLRDIAAIRIKNA